MKTEKVENEEDREDIEKSMFVIDYEGAPPSNARTEAEGKIAGLFAASNAIDPPYSPEQLGHMVEGSIER